MDMARPELITSFGQIQLSYATALVNEPVPDSTESGMRSRQRNDLFDSAQLTKLQAVFGWYQQAGPAVLMRCGLNLLS
jgi:hypothetical protein